MDLNNGNQPIPLMNREISWLYFNERVLQEAADEGVPLIERLRFLAIFSSNLDEFYRVRVATLNRLTEIDSTTKELLSFNPEQVLSLIKRLVIKLEAEFDVLYEKIISELAKEKIHIVDYKALNSELGEFVRTYFQDHVVSKLVPVILTAGKKELPFPNLNDKKIYFFVKLIRTKKSIYSLLEIPLPALPRFIVLPNEGKSKFVILLDDIIRYCLDDLYSIFNYKSIESYTVQITRDAELDLDLSENEVFIDEMTKSLLKREKGKPMRLLYENKMPNDVVSYLVKNIDLKPEGLIPGKRFSNFKDFINFPNIGSKKLEYRVKKPLLVKGIDYRSSLFSQMSKKDFLVSSPYQSYDYIIHFLREAAIDPKVVSIHITLYRLAENSNVINALINAAKNGKKVQVFVELKARFDEKANIDWSKKLQKAGADVKVALGEYKVHSKVCLVKRREKRRIVHYVTLSTGNFNEQTAGVYCDHTLFTKREEIGLDLSRLFKGLRNQRFYGNYKTIITSPLDTRQSLYHFIDREIAYAKEGKVACIVLKMNSLTDEDVIRKLYQASNAGVKIDMIVRGMCCLVPNINGFSENIRVRSIVDRYLEHARVWIFENNGDEELYLTSADFMTRNLDRRVEVTFPVLDVNIKQEIKDILLLQLRDNRKAREINEENDNRYIKENSLSKHQSQVEIYNYLKKKES